MLHPRTVLALSLAGVLFASLLAAASAECCDGFYIALRTAPDRRSSVSAAMTGISDQPDDRVGGCASGRKRTGTFCGRGPCNIFGCNCDGGCIRGRKIDVPTIGRHRSLSFHCDEHVPANLDVMSLVKHRDCTCSDANVQGSEFTLPSPTVVEGPEQDASDPLYCDKGMVYCEVEVRHIKSFGVTTSLSYTGGGNLAKVPVDFSMTYTKEWSESTSTESGHHCTAEGGGVTWLRIKPKYFKVTVISRIPRLDNDRNYCEVKHVYVPKTNPDGSIAGDRRCAFRKTRR